ncbi:MAG: UDP-N-acetylmuramoyl-L-alanyl-D-glutamate--2,6-diaminopimelate ligase [Clostridia bacterium]|nr:UDP-N-acetylmuramoyl-L-alanyl-D-glutamate--2,6-diaminopimelate ligase [Clostridia bacterium]
MVLKELIPGLNGDFEDFKVKNFTDDSRKITPGDIFVCIKGPDNDGHDYAQKAVDNGAAIVVTERDLGLKNQIIVPDTHKTFGLMCAKEYDFPAKKLNLIGITGTNGKTSVSYMVKSILEAAGHKVGLIGTILYMIGDKTIESHNTTPGIHELNFLLSEMVNNGCDTVVMEVSSHALSQRRVEGFHFKRAIFTNLTQDHLDYHKTMENYLNAKKKLFSICDEAIINLDDAAYGELTKDLSCKITTYSLGNNADYSAKSINYLPTGVNYELLGENVLEHIEVSTGGKFTVYNSLAAAVCGISLGVDSKTVASGLKSIKGVKGRAEVVPCDLGFTIIIDYAHTPDGLKNILSAFNECEKNRLTVVFGCGGDRDKTKRPIMGNIAVHYADNVIVTSDNPRSENPEAIIEDILVGVKGINTPVKTIVNRPEAIKYAIKTAVKGDIIVLAGKGHETYQILPTGTIHLDEREVVDEAIEEIKGKKDN